MRRVLTTPLLLTALLLAAGQGRAQDLSPDFNLNAVRMPVGRGCPEDNIPPVPPPTDTGYYARYGGGAPRLESSVTVAVRGGEGRAEILFPGVKPPESAAGYRSALFIRLAEGGKSPVLSWAAVFCSGRRYLGYKGSSLEFPAGTEDFSIKDESLALGPLKVRLARTHPWLVAGTPPDALCAGDAPRRLGYTVKTLPAGRDGLAFTYDRKKNSLTVTWKK